MRKWLVRIVVALSALVVAAIAGLVAAFVVWRAGVERDLPRHSTVVQTARGPVEYAELGRGPAVLVIHGTPGGYDLWFDTYAATHAQSDGFRYILPSRPGYLRTPLSDGATPAQQADVLAALLDALHIGKAAVIGISGGGPAALQFALRHPERCSALVLEEAVVRSLRESAAGLPRSALAADYRDFRIYLLYLAASLYESSPRYAAAMTIGKAQLRASVPYEARKAGLENDLEQEARIGDWPLDRIHCPTLILQGTADRNVRPADAEYAHTAIAGSRLIELPGQDHLMVIFDHARLRALVQSFLREHS